MQAVAESIRDFFGATQSAGDARLHLDGTMNWLCRAQSATGEGGVARTYHLRAGWGAACPGTTGFLIPTFLNYAHFNASDDFRERALCMAEWGNRMQLRIGAVPASTTSDLPSVFGTGQAIFGWCAAYRETGEQAFLAAACRAGDYLIEHQDEDGCWRKDRDRQSRTDTYAYNVRTAWALMVLAEASGEERYQTAAAHNVSAVLRLALRNGWVEKNCATDTTRPLLQTIAYTHEGLLECGLRLGNERAVNVAREGCAQLRRRFVYDGQLHGRYDREWTPSVTWRCLTGEAQTAINWYRLARRTGEREWREAADRLVLQVCETQRLTAPPEIAGGVKGCYPVFGDYASYQYVSWAAKFHADALMIKLDETDAGAIG